MYIHVHIGRGVIIHLLAEFVALLLYHIYSVDC